MVQREYRKIKRPFPPTARAHLVAHLAPPEATSQPFSRPLASPARHTLGCSRECTPAGTVAKECLNFLSSEPFTQP